MRIPDLPVPRWCCNAGENAIKHGVSKQIQGGLDTNRLYLKKMISWTLSSEIRFLNGYETWRLLAFPALQPLNLLYGIKLNLKSNRLLPTGGSPGADTPWSWSLKPFTCEQYYRRWTLARAELKKLLQDFRVEVVMSRKCGRRDCK